MIQLLDLSPKAGLAAYLLYYINLTPTIIALNLEDGSEAWRTPLTQLPFNWTTYPKAARSPDGNLLSLCLMDETSTPPKEYIIVINKDGQVLWTQSVRGREANRETMPLAWSPDSRTLFFMGFNQTHSQVTAYNAQTGEVLWTWTVKDILAYLAAYEGKLAAVSTWQVVYILNTDQGVLIGSPRTLPEQNRGTTAWVNATLLVTRSQLAGVVANKIPPIGLLSINYTQGPRGLDICIVPPSPITIAGYEVKMLCDGLGKVPWTMEARVLQGTYTIAAPAKDVVLALTLAEGASELPGLGRVELSDLARTFLSTMGVIPITNVTVQDAGITRVSVSFEQILRSKLSALEIRGPVDTYIRIVNTGTGTEQEATIPPTGTAIYLLPQARQYTSCPRHLQGRIPASRTSGNNTPRRGNPEPRRPRHPGDNR